MHANGQAPTLEFTKFPFSPPKATNEAVADANGVIDSAVNALNDSSDNSSFAGRWKIVIGQKP